MTCHGVADLFIRPYHQHPSVLKYPTYPASTTATPFDADNHVNFPCDPNSVSTYHHPVPSAHHPVPSAHHPTRLTSSCHQFTAPNFFNNNEQSSYHHHQPQLQPQQPQQQPQPPQQHQTRSLQPQTLQPQIQQHQHLHHAPVAPTRTDIDTLPHLSALVHPQHLSQHHQQQHHQQHHPQHHQQHHAHTQPHMQPHVQPPQHAISHRAALAPHRREVQAIPQEAPLHQLLTPPYLPLEPSPIFIGSMTKDMFITVCAEYLDSKSLLNRDYMTLPTHCEPESVFFSVSKPDISTSDYIRRLVNYTQCSPAAFIMMLIFMERLALRNCALCVTPYNLHRLVITALTLACKVLDDQCFSNVHYAKVGGIPSITEMNRLELQFLFFVCFQLHVTVDEFSAKINHLDSVFPPKSPRSIFEFTPATPRVFDMGAASPFDAPPVSPHPAVAHTQPDPRTDLRFSHESTFGFPPAQLQHVDQSFDHPPPSGQTLPPTQAYEAGPLDWSAHPPSWRLAFGRRDSVPALPTFGYQPAGGPPGTF